MKVLWLDSLPAKKRRRVLWISGLLLFYTVFGFLILPLIVRAVAVKQLSKQLDRPVSIAKVKLNPYTLSATIRGLLVQDKDGQPLLSWDEVYANFQLSSFFGHAWVFKEMRTTRPFVRVQVNKDYSLNISDLIEKFSVADTNAPVKPSKPPALRVGNFQIIGASASLTDLTPRTPFRRIIGPLEITLTEFETHPDSSNPYSFDGTTDAGEKFSWSGHFSLDPIRSSGEFSLSSLSLSKYAPLYQDLVRLEIRDGIIDVRAAYEFVKSATNNVATLTNLQFGLRWLKVAEPGATNNFLEVDRIAVAGTSVDAVKCRGEVRSITAAGGRFTLRRNRDATLNFLEAARPPAAAPNTPGSVQRVMQQITNAFAMLLHTTNHWQATIHAINLEDHALYLEDLHQSRPARLAIDQISLHATNLSNLPGADLTASVSARWNTNGTVSSSVAATILPIRASVRIDVDRIDLSPLDPYLEPFANLYITGGALTVHGRAQIERTNDALPQVSFKGDVALDGFGSVESVFGDELLRWQALRISGLDATLEPLAASIREVAIIEPRATLVINTNLEINLLTAAKMEELNPLLQLTNTAPSMGKAKPPAANVKRETNAAPLALPKISIATIAITNGDVRFLDRSVKPFVNLTMAQLTGTISGLSTEELGRAEVNVTGKVDNTAPVSISGSLNPFSQKQATDLKVSFKDIDLHPASPYSGKFLGYRLNKGKVSLDVHYQMTGRDVKGANLIVIDQLTLGEKTGSPDATRLPVRLAIAVLKDRHGRISLDVPVEGSLDDPKFKLGKVIRETILNMITKIVTSPFAALSAVFGGKGEELSFQQFAAGASSLDETATNKLDTLVKGLRERPGLQVEIEGSVAPDEDRFALGRHRIERELRAQMWKSLRKSEQTRVSPEQVTFAPSDYQDFLRERFAAALKSGALTNLLARTNVASRMTNAVAGVTRSGRGAASGEKGASALLRGSREAAPASAMTPSGGIATPREAAEKSDVESLLVELEEVSENDFAALAARRAQQVKEYLLNAGQVEPDRLFLAEKSGLLTTTNGSRVYLHLR